MKLIDRLDKKDELQNFGYPVSSYGDHYDGKFRDEASLNKSHIKYGLLNQFFFKEGNIGPSEILIEQNNILILSSLKANKLLKLMKKPIN